MKNLKDFKNISLSLRCARCNNKIAISINEELPLQCPHCGRRTSWDLNKIETNKNLENTDKVELIKTLSTNWKKEEIFEAWKRSFDDGEVKFEILYHEALGVGKPLYREDIDNSHEIIVTNDGIWLLKKNSGNIRDKIEIIRGHFRPINRIELDGELLFEVELNEKIVGNAKEIFQRLQIDGNITDKRYAQDVVNRTLLGMAKNTIHAHATFGVYEENDGKLNLCLNPIPRTESQKQAVIEVKKSGALDEEITKEKLEAWMQILNFWEKYEIFPIMGISVISPFALELRKSGLLFPCIYHYSQESGLGKTATARLFTEMLFGKKIESADAINSKYRLADGLDSYGGLIAINEAEKLAWKSHITHLMNATESEIQDRRGTPNLGSRRYFSRGTFIFTGNKFPIAGKPKLVRFLKIEFNEGKKLDRTKKENRTALYHAMKRLKPIGFKLVELELERIDYDIEKLIANIDKHAGEIENIFGVFEDGRRATAWGIVYEGLKIWEYACRKYGVKWSVPRYDDFVKNVVRKIEADTFESKELPAEDFIAWWQAWKARNVVKAYDYEDYIIKGKGKIWDEKQIEINGREIEGDIITNAILREYKKDKGEIETMPDLAKGISLLYGIPYNWIYKVWKIGGKSAKAVFIPQVDENEKEQEKEDEKTT
ncbi:hypothetical protein B6U81_01115 [Thermoplasmatales archaeon ex4484_30]|nr:MAG: hypothetical protein B6U81_01115 [Thermoplasmatales archaeon ex4484_30]